MQDDNIQPLFSTFLENRRRAFYLSHHGRSRIVLSIYHGSILETRNRAFYLSFQHFERTGIGLSTYRFSILREQE
jgi:hypothetical protein